MYTSGGKRRRNNVKIISWKDKKYCTLEIILINIQCLTKEKCHKMETSMRKEENENSIMCPLEPQQNYKKTDIS